ncbi:MAG TPA: M14 metallopeptidase family protein [Vicinamibacterales bacterium]|nr:M14 metallopeptidase family protein [Vicinamibacterales bacterium]
MLQLRAVLVLGLIAGVAGYQSRTISQVLVSVTSPAEEFGASIGDDYFLATYQQLERYWQKLDAESERVRLVSIGRTEEHRVQWMAAVSAPENIEQLDKYREISRRLAQGDADEAQARALAAEGKAIVWIDGGLHADEVLGAQQLIELVYELARADDEEALRFLRDVIVLVVHANPDGHALVADWYMRERDPFRRTLDGLPRSYQKYVGHDNNRDFFLSSQAETINMNRVLYKEWFPQIVLDHHQPGPPGTVMFAPPFRGPFNYVIDPLVPRTLDLVGDAMQARFAAEGKRGVTMRGGAAYSGWWNGGLRTSAYFHNQIGLLTETTGDPTPMNLAEVPDRQVPTADLPMPIAPQRWHFRQAIQYSMTANRAVLDFASRSRETLLANAYAMARNAIAEGSRDSWMRAPAGGDRALRAPRAYVIPSTQADFPTATKFVDALLKAGVTIHRARSPFRANGTSYAAGSYVVKTAQPFRAHVLDMFEPQHYPDDQAPYDIAGWTLALQMGVKFERILDALDGPFERIDVVEPPRSAIRGDGHAGYFLSHHQNDAAVAVNRLLRAGAPVYWLGDRSIASEDRTGSIYVPPGDGARDILAGAARELGIAVTAADIAPNGPMLRLRPLRIGLWDRYGGATSSGWIRWILERYEFPFELAFVQSIDRGDLAGKYDVLILPDDAEIQRVDRTPLNVPSQYRDQTGVLTAARSVPALRSFAENGGTVIAIGQAGRIAASLGVHAEATSYDIPGSILRTEVDNTTPIGFGFERNVDVFFDNSPIFRLSGSVTPVARFEAASLRSGWARGQEQLAGALAAADVPLGRGRIIVFGPQIAFRAQSHATFKFLFNAIYYARAEPHDPVSPPGR